MKMTTTGAALLGALLMASVAAAAQFYKWTDEQGVTHYSEDPPPKSATGTSEVKVQTRLPSDSDEAVSNLQKQRDETLKASDKAKEDATKSKVDVSKAPEKYAEKCKTLQANLQAMQEHGRVKETDDKGEVRVLTDEEKNNRMDETQRQIKAFCQ